MDQYQHPKKNFPTIEKNFFLFFLIISILGSIISPASVYAIECDLCFRMGVCGGDCASCLFCQVKATPSPGETNLGMFEGMGPLGSFIKLLTANNDVNAPLSLLNRIVSISIGLVTLFAFLYFILQFFTAALKWISSGGDQKSIEAAQKQITNSLIGLVIVVSAVFIIDLIGKVLNIQLLNPFEFLKDIWKP